MGLSLHHHNDALDLLSPGPSQVTSRPCARTHYQGAYLRPDGSLLLNRQYADCRLPLLDLVLHANQQRRSQQQQQHQRQQHRHPRRRQYRRSVQQWRTNETADGRALAATPAVRLPGSSRNNTPQLRRTPSLERQGAFQAPRTSKSTMDREEKDVAELYRLGLLYDDEHLRGSGFELDAIVHSDPDYAVRPAKRPRRSNKSRRQSYEESLQLALDLSLAELGRDESFARHLLSPDLEDTSTDDESTQSTSSHLISALMSSGELFGDDTPDLTTDSDSDHVSLTSCSEPDDECWSTTRPAGGERRRRRRRSVSADYDVSDNAWMTLGDGS